MTFFLGTHLPHWLWQVGIPLFVSRRTLSKVKKLYRASATWALDSGGFSELNLFSGWKTPPRIYAQEVQRWKDEIGGMVFASQQDWMCEPWMLKKTGKTIQEHQQLTLDNYAELLDRAPHLPWLPVLQGWELSDYQRHLDSFRKQWPVRYMGLGSVCRRQGTLEIQSIVETLAKEVDLHGFGVKTRGLSRYAQSLTSSDSLAWSFSGRRQPPMPGHTHKNCANCLSYALKWREKVLAGIN